jgi:hypothetical protein
MAKAADPKLLAILEEYGETPREAMWDCHGTWVIYHRAIERIAARAKISFDMPEIVEAKSADKIVAIVARGFMGDRSEWSFGEAAPGNNKNSYPYAMAEKRAKDRVVLKLVGLHGLAYSEEESDDFRASQSGGVEVRGVSEIAPKRQVGINPQTGMATAHALKKDTGPDNWPAFQAELLEAETVPMLTKLALGWSSIAERDKWPTNWRELAKEEINKRRETLINGAPDDDTFPGDRPSTKGNAYADSFRAG